MTGWKLGQVPARSCAFLHYCGCSSQVADYTGWCRELYDECLRNKGITFCVLLRDGSLVLPLWADYLGRNMASRIDYKLAPSFDIEAESHLFREWRSMWTGFECLSGISAIADDVVREKTRLQAFSLSVSKETLRIVNHLPVADRTSLDSVLSALEAHIVGTTNEVFERREFWKRTQRDGESFSNYLLALRELASRCNFARCCTNCEALQLRDRITTGLRDAGAIKKLLLVGSTLTLAKVKDICEADESAKEKCAAVTSSSVNVLRKKTSSYKAAQKKKETDQTGECKFCGRQHILRKDRCPAYGKSCTRCSGEVFRQSQVGLVGMSPCVCVFGQVSCRSDSLC